MDIWIWFKYQLNCFICSLNSEVSDHNCVEKKVQLALEELHTGRGVPRHAGRRYNAGPGKDGVSEGRVARPVGDHRDGAVEVAKSLVKFSGSN